MGWISIDRQRSIHKEGKQKQIKIGFADTPAKIKARGKKLTHGIRTRVPIEHNYLDILILFIFFHYLRKLLWVCFDQLSLFEQSKKTQWLIFLHLRVLLQQPRRRSTPVHSVSCVPWFSVAHDKITTTKGSNIEPYISVNSLRNTH